MAADSFTIEVNTVWPVVIPGATSTSAGVMTAEQVRQLEELTIADAFNAYVASTGSDSNDGLTPSTAVLTFEAAFQVLPPIWGSTFIAINVAGNVTWTTLPNLIVGKQAGIAVPLLIQGAVTDELGTLTAASGATTGSFQDLVANANAISKTGSAASIVAGAAAGSMRLSGMGTHGLAVGDQILIRRANSQGNNSTFTVSVIVSTTSVDVINAQAVVTDANNGAIYWQQSFEMGWITIASGTGVGGRKQIKNHGQSATCLFTAVAKASITDNQQFTVVDSLNQSKGFEFKVTGGFAPTPGFTTIDISAGTVVTATDVCDATVPIVLGAVGTLMQITAWRATATTMGLRQNIEGTVGNTTNSKTGGATFTISNFTGGTGALLTAFTMLTAFSPAPVAGSTFNVEKTNRINFGAGTGQVLECGGGALGLKNIEFYNTGTFGLTLRSSSMVGESYAFFANGATIQLAVADVLTAGNAAPAAQWANAGASNPFATTALKQGCGYGFRNGTFMLNDNCRTQAVCAFRSATINGVKGSTINALPIDAKRTSVTVNGEFTNSGGTGTLEGQLTASATAAIFTVGQGGVANSMATMDISGSAGHGVLIQGGGIAIMGTVTGQRNVSNGIRCLEGGLAVVTASTTAPTGNAGDMLVGRRVKRYWADFGATAPIGIERDVTGDGSMIVTLTSTAYGLTQIVSGGAVPTVAAGAGAGSAPTSITVTGDNVAGTVTLVTNVADTPAASDTIFTLTFAAPGFPSGTTPRLVWEPANDATANLAYGIWRSRQADTTVLLATLRSGAAPLPATTAATYVWNYHVIAR